jgi:hypothetical protein
MLADDVERFFGDFLDAEREAIFSKYSDWDEPYRATLDRLRVFFAMSIILPSNFNRPPAPLGTSFEEYVPNRARIAKRRMFKLAKWMRADGELYGAYTGSIAGNPSYHTLWLARPFDARLGVVTELGVCIDCYAVDPECARCSGAGWERMHGERLDAKSLGVVEWTRKLAPPRGPERADYDKD